ncbi:MAG: CoB--CoM heterodisulfide reductase iron-sulfur subunit B family protein [Treponema sp.]|jgi:heterodisulfide reductase subunit B|nr:CoB--CoM heterodisulfide reductase iron-sulfur subunit B family protein [Treponema sp.]MBQ1971880.1 CoB--CoM heterodisulfide reductase iron-sulfur subunit B family protein [Treponema sp.]MBQ2234336.1 CoB--CoM heterodisulfide reductase iron-sulfur subunit B family protein [Treponema sp.]MBQ5633172.1 CoB--CoM heterodisulfide reductase iron-sulfur subunit B family protein [Treponema sp.]MBQ5647375.1 CoB--CoM heterodisulfide reductase iron-sulfur subunit B family protein [Treponema sp.]
MSDKKIYSYFPGCTLKNKAIELDAYARFSAEALGFELKEIEEWQCCGGVYPMSQKEVAPKLPSVRALADARDNKQDLVTLCAACYNVLKQTNDAILNDGFTAFKANTYLKQDGIEYNGETKVLHFLEILRDVIGWDNVKAAVKNPLKGKKIGAYYGCLLLRPANVMKFDDPENPQIIEDFIKAIGATPVIFAQRNECCGAYTMFEDNSIPEKRANAIISNAEDFGAEMLVTSCPLCRYNLIKNKKDSNLDVIYFTELLAEALGVKEAALESIKKEATNA